MSIQLPIGINNRIDAVRRFFKRQTFVESKTIFIFAPQIRSIKIVQKGLWLKQADFIKNPQRKSVLF